MLLALILLLVWPVAELFVAIKVGEALGVLPTIALLVASWPAGSWALRSQGRAAWRRFAAAVSQRRPPGREAVDGTLVLLGGGLLIVPGFITDAAGIVLLAPPTRALLRRLLIRNFRSRLLTSAVRVTRSGQPYDGDSTAHDVEQPRLRR
jgi:UPF0716 protein FxsA